MKFTWVDDIRWTGVDAQTVGEALDVIKEQNDGVLTAAAVVDASRPQDAPLHPCFEWNDTKAAEEFRKTQARTIIRSIRVAEDTGPGQEASEPQRVYVHVEDKKKGAGYQPLTAVMSDEELRQQVISNTIDALAKLRLKLARLLDLEDICAAIQQLEDKLVEKAMKQSRKERKAAVTSLEAGRVNIRRVG